MERVRFRTILRAASLALILAVSGWALLPPPAERDTPGSGQRSHGGDVRYVIRVSPGPQYMPGSAPFGIGEPLRGLNDVIQDFEARFPDTRVEVLTVPGVREYLVPLLSSGQAPDIINVNVEDVWVDVQKNWYVPLDAFLEAPNEFIREQGDPAAPGHDQWWDMFKYQAISRGKAAPDGKNYCLSYDMIETGIFYNKTIFREVGVDVPEDWEAFLVVLRKLKEAGHTPLLMHADLFNDWSVDLFFDQLYYDLLPGIDLYQDPTREPYLEGYLDDFEVAFLFQQGFFTQRDPRYMEIWRIMKEMRQYTNQNIATVDLTREFVTRKAAMVWNTSWFLYRLQADRQLGFDWGVFYMPQFTKKTTPFASETPMCVIGGASVQFEVTSSALSDTPQDMPFEARIENSERLKRVMQFLQFLCVPEQYVRIVNEYEGFLPNIVGVPVGATLKPFEEILDRRYTTTKWTYTFDLKFNEIQRRCIELYLNGGINLEEFMDWQVSNIVNGVDNLLFRKKFDADQLQRAWDEKAPIRAGMEGLPHVE